MGKLKVSKNESRKDLIVKAGASLFREKGFGAASMRDLAENIVSATRRVPETW